MSVLIACEHCGRKLRIPETAVGKRIKCPRCAATFVATEMPSEGVTAAVPEPAPRKKPANQARATRRAATEDEETAGPEGLAEVPDRPMEFKVVIKRDPDKLLKGIYQARAQRRGILLSKGKEEPFRITVGTPVEYAGGNGLKVMLDGREVEMRVTRFGAYQQRLARDVAAFLRGKKSLNPSAYRMEWYLFIPAVLPMGIPVLTLGGALPGAIGFGLAGACFGIAQKEDWPVWLRLLLALGLAGAGYVALFALVFYLGMKQFQLPQHR